MADRIPYATCVALGWLSPPSSAARASSLRGRTGLRRSRVPVPPPLTGLTECSTFVLMEVETLGVARSLGWKVHMRCANGYRLETRSMRKCVYRKQLDLETLVATRGPNFPLGRLEGRLMCPACGNRRVTVVFEPPSNAMVG
jgi:hypothetical protein